MSATTPQRIRCAAAPGWPVAAARRRQRGVRMPTRARRSGSDGGSGSAGRTAVGSGRSSGVSRRSGWPARSTHPSVGSGSRASMEARRTAPASSQTSVPGSPARPGWARPLLLATNGKPIAYSLRTSTGSGSITSHRSLDTARRSSPGRHISRVRRRASTLPITPTSMRNAIAGTVPRKLALTAPPAP
jgi:hypothetical protein